MLPAVLAAYRRPQPEAELTFDEGLLVQALPGLIEGRIDFAIALASPQDLPYEIEFEALADIEAVPFARNSHPLIEARDWATLSDTDWVLNLSAGSQSMNLVDWLAHRGIAPPHRITHCSSPFLIVELARRNDLIGYGPKVLITDPRGRRLRALAVSLPPTMLLGLLSLRRAARQRGEEACEPLPPRAAVLPAARLTARAPHSSQYPGRL